MNEDERKALADKAREKHKRKAEPDTGEEAPVAPCKLCLQIRKLCESHIIPEFFYTRLYDGKHKIKVLSTDATKNPKVLQKGVKEYLLCPKCDNEQFGNYEGYTASVFSAITDAVAKDRREVYPVINLLYAPIKLFFMSLLWRMGISSRDMFKDIKLGEHEEKLRLALLAENPLAPTDYPFTVRAIFLGGEFLDQLTGELPPPIDVPNAISFAVQGFRFDLITELPPGANVNMLFGWSGTLPIYRTDVESESLLGEYIRRQWEAEKTRNERRKN